MSKESTTETINVEELKKQFSDYLRKKKYRNTLERYLVLDRIAELDNHFSADELYLYMLNFGDKISRATVYSTLDLLTSCRILMKHRFQSEGAKFELASRLPHHDHLICIECGHIIEFRDPSVESIQQKVCAQFGFEPIEHSLQLFAVCKDPRHCEHNQ